MKTILFLAALYGTLVGQELKKAPLVVTVDGVAVSTRTISEKQANAIGYKLVEDFAPATDSNHYTIAVGWAETNRIYRVYEIKENPPPAPRRFYKYDVSAACDEFGELDKFIALVSADAKTKWFYDNAEILVENDPFFISVTNAVISSGAMSEANVRKILDRAYELGQVTAMEAK